MQEQPKSESTEQKEQSETGDLNYVYLTADCGCRFQIVSALPVLNAGVLLMPDLEANVCDQHRPKPERMERMREEQANKVDIIGIDGKVIN